MQKLWHSLPAGLAAALWTLAGVRGSDHPLSKLLARGACLLVVSFFFTTFFFFFFLCSFSASACASASFPRPHLRCFGLHLIDINIPCLPPFPFVLFPPSASSSFVIFRSVFLFFAHAFCVRRSGSDGRGRGDALHGPCPARQLHAQLGPRMYAHQLQPVARRIKGEPEPSSCHASVRFRMQGSVRPHSPPPFLPTLLCTVDCRRTHCHSFLFSLHLPAHMPESALAPLTCLSNRIWPLAPPSSIR